MAIDPKMFIIAPIAHFCTIPPVWAAVTNATRSSRTAQESLQGAVVVEHLSIRSELRRTWGQESRRSSTLFVEDSHFFSDVNACMSTTIYDNTPY